MDDELRFAIAPVSAEAGADFEVQVFVNGVEMTAAGAGLGMDPYAVLIPDNALAAAVARTLLMPPASWSARWHRIDRSGAPDVAGPAWSPYRI